MGAQKQEKKKADAQWRNKTKCARYRSQMRREHNKLRRILKSSGLNAARQWAEKNDAMSVLNTLLR